VLEAYTQSKFCRFVVRADEKLTAFLELQTAIHQLAVDAMM